MAIEVEMKDSSALGDAELSEMADLCVGSVGHEAGALSKQAEDWVLVSRAYSNGELSGFVFSTLERIGGTPAVVIGLASVGRTPKRSSVLAALMNEQYHKARMAFPDEDVVVAGRAVGVGAYEALAGLADIRPWPGSRVNGEQRAWGRRLAKRFSISSFDDRSMAGSDRGDQLIIDHESATSGAHDEAAELFSIISPDEGEFLVIWGWAMVEMLDTYT